MPLIPHLVDQVRYYLPDDVPPPEGQDLRAMARPKIGKFVRPVKAGRAQACESAEELGQRLKRRYQRQQQRQGLPPVGRSRAEAEVDHVLGKR